MSLLKKMFGNKSAASSPAASAPASSRFQDSDDPDEDALTTRTASRRDVVHVVLRETMRRHGIPSDWIECRILTVVSRTKGQGAHLTLIVKGGQDRLLSYVPAFQSSFYDALGKFDPKSGDWMLSLSWQFPGGAPTKAMPDPSSWAAPAALPKEEEDLQEDLQALFAIRDAAMRDDIHGNDFQPTQPGGSPVR